MQFLDLLVFCMPAWVGRTMGPIPKPKENICAGATGGSLSIAIAECSAKKVRPKHLDRNRIVDEG
jgi:hypothetical protein